jgi:hypothetical protein
MVMGKTFGSVQILTTLTSVTLIKSSLIYFITCIFSYFPIIKSLYFKQDSIEKGSGMARRASIDREEFLP